VRAQFAKITIGPLGTNLKFAGNAVTSAPASGPLKMSFSCDGKFVAYQD
jgi:hypothetical protein